MMDTENPITQLSAEDALKFLSQRALGRLAISINGRPDIFPINYAINARSNDDVVAYIRASAGNKLGLIAKTCAFLRRVIGCVRPDSPPGTDHVWPNCCC